MLHIMGESLGLATLCGSRIFLIQLWVFYLEERSSQTETYLNEGYNVLLKFKNSQQVSNPSETYNEHTYGSGCWLMWYTPSVPY